MGDIASLLQPISPDHPAGEDIRYAPEFDELREARRQEDSSPKGIWEREVKSADYKLVSKLAESILTTKSKDLRVAVWLAEAWIYRDGPAGLASGIALLQGLVESFWEHLYPPIDDLETRAAPLEWFGSYFDPAKGSSPKLAICRFPLVKGKYDFYIYQESRRVGYDADVKDNDTRKKARAALIAEGKISADVFDKAFGETPKDFYKQLAANYQHGITALAGFDTLCREKFGELAPSFNTLRKTLDEVANSVHILLARKLELEPDPEPVGDAPAEPTFASESAASPAPGTHAVTDLSKFAGGQIASAEDAVMHVLAAAQFIRQNNPASPVSYLLLRAVRWGEVRATGGSDLGSLVAPSGDVRVTLRNAAGANNWRLVLDVAEAAMSHLTGRGWLDLQRYSVRACDELGYTAAAKALRSELKCFLADFPQLPKAILNDDTGAANPETLAWLEKEGLLSAAK